MCMWRKQKKKTNTETSIKFIVSKQQIRVDLINAIKIQYSEENEISFLLSTNGILKTNPKSIS